ncbi:MAG: biotin--[acetyl-CoA-carboxylase] ligase [Lachnospiraceae bacterium]|jgi:BirA family biotin operon repressor/biotin-[acetyl-CoA-carboxylase] ligase|nr:biotin--[acetyl-CoA-carboxylase] ligase [Lachnospiraceae bacterium]
MKTKILEILRQADREAFISGQELCGQLGVSRTAVWKSIKQLKEAGYQIEAIQNKGYRLLAAPDILSKSEIESRLQTRWVGRPIHYYHELDSTNNEAKRMAEEKPGLQGHGAVIVAESQNAGRGRRGRGWDSPQGSGIFFTILLKPGMDPANAPMLTLVKALAAAKGIQKSTGLDAAIKWPNDVVVGGRKVVGILTEMSAQVDYVNHIVVGTGINVHQTSFPEELASKATSLDIELGQAKKQVLRAALLAAVLEEFEHYYEAFMQTQDLSALREEYNALLVNCGRQVRVLDPLGEFEGKALGINERGELLVEREGGAVKVSSGEVSVRGIYGYV